MKYMVMECHLSYAVVLDEDGRFLNTANRHYEVGQTVTDIIKMQESLPTAKEKSKIPYKWIASLMATAACLVLIVTAVFQFGTGRPYGSVYMTINPEVRIDVDKNDRVMNVEGLNKDGKALIADYSYKKKDLDLVMDELVDLAIEMGYLYEGGQISLTLEADSNEWVVKKGSSLGNHLTEQLANRLSVTIEITNTNEITNTKTESQSSIVPAAPETGGGDTNYTDTDYGPNNDGVTDYTDTDYGPNSDGVTDYTDTDYGPNNDGVTSYEDTSGDDTSYDDHDYEDDDRSGGSTNYSDNGNSNYNGDGDDDEDD